MMCLVAWMPLDLKLVPRPDNVLAVLEMVSDVHSNVKLVMPLRRLWEKVILLPDSNECLTNDLP